MSLQQSSSSPDGQWGSTLPPPEILIDLVADNAQLRAALALAEGAGLRRDLITQELKHRIGNLLTVVQAIARKTFATVDAASVVDFNARLRALATAQALLIDSETRAAMLSEVVRAAVAPHSATEDQFRVSGVDLPLDGRRAHALTLALHELATNAAKYGALSVEGGWIEIAWSDIDGAFDLLWREHDGPPVTAPTRKGFGSRLITANLGVAFLGSADLRFNATGVECQLRGAR
jgi:two-component sensor histidine kinase